jgi:transcriptional regulator with XRE-family HTH domain
MFGRKERKRHWQREPLASLEDMRDDCVALFLNSGLTQDQVHQRGGPTAGTISKWLYKETRFPRLDTMRALVRALGCDFVIVPADIAAQYRGQAREQRLALDVTFAGTPRLTRPKRRG